MNAAHGHCRTIASLNGPSNGYQDFLTGTCSVKGQNSIIWVKYHESDNLVSLGGSIPFKTQVRRLAVHPSHESFVVVSSHDTSNVVRFSSEKLTCDEVAELPGATYVCWEPEDEEKASTERLVSTGGGYLRIWDLQSEKAMDIGECPIPRCSALAWNPHQLQEVSVASNGSIVSVDLREMTVHRTIDSVHDGSVLEISYNTNLPYYIASAGTDGFVKFWDVRNPAQPIAIISAHQHWVNSVCFNKFHDQLLLTAGSDASAKLWRVSSISSAPLLDEEEEDPTQSSNDVLISNLEDFSDAVYSVAWSSSDAWTYAAVSYDGRVCVNRVPSAEKYKILL